MSVENRRSRLLVLTLFAGVFAYGLWHIRLGIDFRDEGMFLATPLRYALEPHEKEQLERALASEMARDVRHDVLAALFDRLEDPEDPERKSEILKILRGLMPSLLSSGAIESVAGILEELAAVRTEPGILDKIHQRECDDLLDDLSSPETIEELVRALQDGTIDVSVDVLSRLLKFLRADALPVLLAAARKS